MVSKRAVVGLIVFIVLFSSANVAFAVQTNESRGPNGYGWQQAWDGSGGPEGWDRLTGSADRQYYDYKYKNITITGRLEDYWATDCGWWYITGSGQIDSFKMWDNASDLVLSESSVDTSKGTANFTYGWGSSSVGNGKDDPGTWTVQITEGTIVTQFYVYVRGQLDVTSIGSTGSQSGSPVAVTATVKDHADNTITSSTANAPAVTMYVTGAGFANESTMTYDGGWVANFTPPKPGDYYITVKASDNHTYWIDGRGRAKAAVSGTFPYSFGSSAVKAFIMMLLALAWLRRRQPPGRAKPGSLKFLVILLAISVVVI